jgi:hypothetical protein
MSKTRTEHPEWTDRLSAYLAGELPPHDHRMTEDHLGECGACRRVLEDLREVIAQAASLEDMSPPRDLWAGIAATIQAPVAATANPGAKVIELPTARDLAHPMDEDRAGVARYAFSRPQLAAAAIVLIAASSIATWVAGPGLGIRSEETPVFDGASAVTMASTSVAPPQGLADELAMLEEALVVARATLEPNTVRILERNLGVIEQAILDSHQALEQDPGNEFLTDHLARVYQRKLTYLRDATRVAEWAG